VVRELVLVLVYCSVVEPHFACPGTMIRPTDSHLQILKVSCSLVTANPDFDLERVVYF